METGMEGTLDVQMLLSVGSFSFTTYFWFVKARRERPSLQCVQLSDFRATVRRHPKTLKRSVWDSSNSTPAEC
jgi:hypothetical protein